MSLSNLFTKADIYHFHKICGAYVAFNFVYQYMSYLITGTMIFNEWNLIPHFLLHISSFSFHVLRSRSIKQKLHLFVWEELRLHSLVFAYRGCLCILFPSMRVPIIFMSMIMADVSTLLTGEHSMTMVRGLHNIHSSKLIKTVYKMFLSVSQISATIICGGFFQLNYSPVLVFSTLLPIQTYAFGMLLIRNDILNKKQWQIIYIIEILFMYYFWIAETGNYLLIIMSIFCYYCRKFGISKYHLFLSVFLAHMGLKYSYFINERIYQDMNERSLL